MAMFFWTSIFLWISVTYLIACERTKVYPLQELSARCEFVSRNVCLEYVEEETTWSQARSSCEERGGKLLQELNAPVKVFLISTTKRSSGNLTWWMGQRVAANRWELDFSDSESLNPLCGYVKLNPLQMRLSDCSKRRSFFCTYSPKSPEDTKRTVRDSQASRSRFRRSLTEFVADITNIDHLLAALKEEIRRMETTPGEPADSNRDAFVQQLLRSTTIVNIGSPTLKDQVKDIVKCSMAIMQLSLAKCDVDTNPNPPSFSDKVFEIITAASLLDASPQNETTVFKFATGSLYQTITSGEELSNAVLGSEEDGEYIRLPSFSAMESHLKDSKTVITQLTTMTNSPHRSNVNMSGHVCNLLLTSGNSKKEIKLENLTEMVEIFLRQSGNSTVTNSTFALQPNTKIVTSLNITDPEVTVIFDMKPNVNAFFEVMLALGSPPNSTYFTNKTILSHTENYRWMIDPDVFQRTPGIWYIDIRLSNFTQQSSVSVKTTSYMSKCLYWDTNSLQWSTSGCKVGNQTTPELAHCMCNHLTMFGSSFFVMPNHVDISRTAELFATVTENFVVLALLCSFFSVYLITLLWANYADRRARFKRKMTLLEDNHPGTQYNYLVCVQTGHRTNAGTSASVTAKLVGSEGESNTHNLTDPVKPVFERGACDMFLLSTPFPLGEVRNLRLQHDNSGGHPSWYIKKVIIQDLQNHQVFHFFCDCWLSSDRGDGMTKKTFNAAKNNEIASFRNIFQTRTLSGFRDEHIWVSIWDPPSRSPFTRAQRVSCCMSLLLCTMAINIAFWSIAVDDSYPVLFTLGSLRITWQEIMVGIESGLLMFPINILIITIFRSIKPRMSSNSKKDDESQRIPSVGIPTILKEIEEVFYLASMSPRTKMSGMPKLESAGDISPALQRMNELIQFMQGESSSDNYLVYCSKFLLAALCHILRCLEKLDGKHFQSQQEYQDALNGTNLLVRKAEMVFSSHLANCPVVVRKKKKRSTGYRLPWWFVFIGWFLLLSISALSTYFTLLYGFEYGKEKSIKWVMSLGLSLFESIFILQPLKVIGVAVFFALLLKPVAVEETEEAEQVLTEQQERCRRYTGRETL